MDIKNKRGCEKMEDGWAGRGTSRDGEVAEGGWDVEGTSQDRR